MTEQKFLKRFSDWASDLQLEDIPEPVVKRAKLQVINIIAAGMSGQNSRKNLTGEFLDQTEHGDCMVLGGWKRDPQTALFLNTTYSMLHDFDDYLFMGHTGHSAVYGSLLACELNDSEGSSLLKGVLVANELEGRLGASVFMGPHNGQMWSFIHQAGTAAAVSTILNGSASQIYHSINMALYNIPYPGDSGFMGGDAKALTASSPSTAGLQSALLGLSGARAETDCLQGQGGFLDHYPYVVFSEMLDALGESWVTSTLCYKSRPGCAYLQTPLEGLMQILDETPVENNTISKIQVQASLVSIIMESMSRQFRRRDCLSPTNITFSIPYSLAMALLRGKFDGTAIDWKFIEENRDSLDRAAGKIELEHRWDHTLNLIQGVLRGVDFPSLVSTKGYYKLISGFFQMRKQHPNVSLGKEFLGLLTSGDFSRVFDTVQAHSNADPFDFSEASLEDLRFDFGSTVHVKTTSGTIYSRTVQNHPGSCRREYSQLKSVVQRKYRTIAEQYFADPERIDAVLKIVSNLENRVVSDLTNALL